MQRHGQLICYRITNVALKNYVYLPASVTWSSAQCASHPLSICLCTHSVVHKWHGVIDELD